MQTLWNGNKCDTGGYGVFKLDLQPGKQISRWGQVSSSRSLSDRQLVYVRILRFLDEHIGH
jgi:hypothetical protein